jgi:membrane associated rhomboid family serine protease
LPIVFAYRYARALFASADNDMQMDHDAHDAAADQAAYHAGLPQEARHEQPQAARQERVPYVSYALIGACAAVFLGFNLAQGEQALLRLVFSPGRGLVWPGLLTHMFAHASPMHLLGNMLGVYYLGTAIERRYGPWKYYALYFTAGLIAALAQAWAEPEALLLGASGALAGVMAAFLRHYPHTRLYIYGVLPVPTWVFMPIWLVLNFLGASYGQSLGIAFIAHLAGFAAGGALSFLFAPPLRRSGEKK